MKLPHGIISSLSINRATALEAAFVCDGPPTAIRGSLFMDTNGAMINAIKHTWTDAHAQADEVLQLCSRAPRRFYATIPQERQPSLSADALIKANQNRFWPSNLSDHYFQMPLETCHSLLLEQSAQTEHSGCKRGSRLAPEVNVCVFVSAENLLCQGLRIIPNHPSSHLTRVTCQSPSWLHPSKDQRRLETAHISNAGRVWRSQQGFARISAGSASLRHFPLNIIRRLQKGGVLNLPRKTHAF